MNEFVSAVHFVCEHNQARRECITGTLDASSETFARSSIEHRIEYPRYPDTPDTEPCGLVVQTQSKSMYCTRRNAICIPCREYRRASGVHQQP